MDWLCENRLRVDCLDLSLDLSVIHKSALKILVSFQCTASKCTSYRINDPHYDISGFDVISFLKETLCLFLIFSG